MVQIMVVWKSWRQACHPRSCDSIVLMQEYIQMVPSVCEEENLNFFFFRPPHPKFFFFFDTMDCALFFLFLLPSRSSLPWTNLLHVDLCQNYLTDRGASVIGNTMLPHCEHLHTLLLSDCFIHDIGFMAIMKAIWSKETERRGGRSGGARDEMSDGTSVVDGLLGSLVESKKEVGIEGVEGVGKSDAACKPRRWRLVDLSANGVTDQGVQEFRVYMLKGSKQYQKMKRVDHQQRKRRGKGRRKRETISTRFRDYEKEEEECLDAYRSYVREMRLCDNAITVAGA